MKKAVVFITRPSYRAKQVAHYLINKALAERKDFSNIRLEILLYNIQIRFVRKYGIPCFREKMIASKAGAIVPELFREYFICGANSVYFSILSPYKGDELPDLTNEERKTIDEVYNSLIDAPLWKIYSKEKEEGQPYQIYYSLYGEDSVIENFEVIGEKNR